MNTPHQTTGNEITLLTANNRVAIGTVEVVPASLRKLALRELAQARAVLAGYGLGDVGSVTEGIQALGLYATRYGWDVQALEDLRQTQDDMRKGGW